MHPLAFPGNKSGAMGMVAGDPIIYKGKRGTVDEFLPDGDAFVSFDDGTFETVKWLQHRGAGEMTLNFYPTCCGRSNT